jgi:hypothetical protein
MTETAPATGGHRPPLQQENPDPPLRDLKVTPHPFLVWRYTADQLDRAERDPDMKAVVLGHYHAREDRIRMADLDPFHYTFRITPEWDQLDACVKEYQVTNVFGANRTTKSHWAAHALMQEFARRRRCKFMALGTGERQAVATQHAMLWHYMNPRWRALNGRRHHTYKINYSQAGGFTEGKVVSPLGAELYLVTYNMDPIDFEGWEYGAQDEPFLCVWADEKMPLSWLKYFVRRLRFSAGRMAWTYTPLEGLTPAINEVLGSNPLVLESKAAELLPNAQVPGCPAGHMPTKVKPVLPNSIAIYLHLGVNPFHGYTEKVRELCQGKTTELIERLAYGYARQLKGRVFRYFGSGNIIKPEQLPAEGTNYMFLDPHGDRPWPMIWLRVAADGRMYVYRDWPDLQTFGEWAVPTERETDSENRRGWDGDPGPAQISNGWGRVQYKREILRLERVGNDPAIERDPYRKRIAEEGGGMEFIFERYVDPRAGESPHQEDTGSLTWIQWMMEGDADPETGGMLEGLYFRAAQQLGSIATEMLRGTPELITLFTRPNLASPLVRVVNEPRLYVVEDCEQFIWCIQNYTGLGLAKGAAKDFVDLGRYLATAPLVHMEADMMKGGSYGATY